jgi:ankyrin repeat protein
MDNQESPMMTNIESMLSERNKSKYTPLHVAIYYGNFNVIREILSYATSNIINACDDQNHTSLHMAAEKGSDFSMLKRKD